MNLLLSLLRPIRSRSGNRRQRAGFSLVEVTLALGVVAFGAISVIGLLPVGMSVHRQSINMTVSAQIVQRITGDVGQADMTQLISPGTGEADLPVRYFDDQGNELLVNGLPDASASNRVYDVKVNVASPVLVLDQKSYNLTNVHILIAYNPSKSANIFDPSRGLYTTYSAMVARRS